MRGFGRTTPLDRRAVLGLAAAGSVAGAAAGVVPEASGAYDATLPWQDGMADAPDPGRTGQSFLTPAELAFVTAAADRIIPADPTGPSASQAGVPTFIDRQLAGPYGAGEHVYLGGPWPAGTPSQGFQGRFSPAALYRVGILSVEDWIGRAHGGAAFADLSPQMQDAALSDLEAGRAALADVDGKQFFELLHQNVKEGYFSDPIYGGNRGLAAWRMIGFPGARYDYTDWVTRHGERVALEPVSLGGRPAWRMA